MDRLRRISIIWIVLATVLVLIVIYLFGGRSTDNRPYELDSARKNAPEVLKRSTQRSFVRPNNSSLISAQKHSHDYKIPAVTNGLVPVLSKIPTSEPVVFLGIDDGANKTANELQMMKDNNIKASLFLADRFINMNRSFFKDFIDEGSLIENHTTDHKLLSNLSYEDQRTEICGMADLEYKEYGRRPVLLRPPGGDYNIDTQKAAADCGMKALIIWNAKANGGVMQYQNGHKLSSGDIVLMHFRPEFQSDMQSFIDAFNASGLHTELLEDWL